MKKIEKEKIRKGIIYQIFFLILAVSFVNCTNNVKEKDECMLPNQLNPLNFATRVEGKEVGLYTLKNKMGMEVSVTNYGGRIVSVLVPDKEGNLGDVVCGFDSISDYVGIKQNFGAAMGRYIGRINDSRFVLDGETYILNSGGEKNLLHGGSPSFANHVWSVMNSDSTHIALQYVSPDGENGFPGELTVDLTYSLTDNYGLKIEYKTSTTKPTVLNLANHSFFNLSGDLSKTVLDETLWIAADSISEIREDKCSTGKMLAVKDTPFDFTVSHKIGNNIHDSNEQLKFGGNGYDHCYQLNEPSLEKPAACLYDESSGRILEVYTTQPGLQLYTANSHNGKIIGKNGIAYNQYNSVCLETTYFPNSPNVPEFPSTVLRPNEEFKSTTIYKFSLTN